MIKTSFYMAIYADEINVSFFNDKTEMEYKLNDITYSPNCKICRDIQCFRSLNRNKDYSKLCRRCAIARRVICENYVFIRVFKCIFNQT